MTLAVTAPAAASDTTGPTLVGGTAHGTIEGNGSEDSTRITLYFSEELDPDFVPVANDDIVLFNQAIYDFDENGPTLMDRDGPQTYDSVQVEGNTLVLLDAYPLGGNIIHRIKIADTTRIRDRSGNQAEAPAGRIEVVNMIGLGVFFKAPGVPRRAATDPAVVDGNTLTVKLDQTLTPFTKVAGTGGFTISGAATAVTHVEGHATTVALTLNREVGGGETGLTLSYQPGTPAIRNLYDEKLAAFTGQAVANARADTTAPTLVASTISGTDVRLRFSEAMNAASPNPAASQFELDTGSGADLGTVTLVSIAGNVIRLSTQHAASASDTVTLTVTTTTNIRDLAGNAMTSVSGFALTNTGGTAPGGPALAATDQAVLLGNVLTLTFDQTLDSASVPPASAFSVSGAWPPAFVDGVAIDGAKALLTLRQSVPGDARGIAASYAAGQGLRNLWGEAASGVDGQAVRVAGPDGTPPALVGVEVRDATLTLTFDEALDATSVPPGTVFAVWALDENHRTHWIPGTGRAAVQDTAVTVSLAATVGSWREAWYAAHHAGGSPLQDAAGNKVPGSGCWGGGQCTYYGWGPRLVSGSVRGKSMALRFSKTLDESSVPKARAFSVTVDDAAVTPGNIAVSGFEVTMELPSATAADTVVKVGFSRPTGIRDLDGREARVEDGAYTLTNLTPPEPAALTASFHGLPQAHDGRRLFGFEIRFSEEFRGLTLTALKEGALAVTGGRLVDVKRTVRGENRSVTARVRPSQSGDMTLTLPATSDCAAVDAICASDGRKLSAAVSATVPGPDSATTTLPVLSVADTRAEEGGNLEFAVTLSEAAAGAVTVDYATADGTATAGADYTAASGTLTFAAGETAKTVEVSALADAAMEDDETFTLTLSNASGATIGTAAATGTVADVAPPLTASFHGLPAEHDGKKLFAFEVRFSEEFRGLRLTAFKAGALQVTNSRVVDAKRTVRGQNRSVTVRVRPSSVDDLTLTLPATTDCTAATAICTSDGRELSETVTATVQGPVAVSVADAEAQEGTDAAVEFAVTLSRAASGEVTVNYATRDGTATAGEDYTFTRGTLTFDAGETSKTVSVPILDDALDEGSETFTLKLTGVRGAAIGDGEATGTITNADPLQTMWLSRFGRTVADHVTGAVSDRLSNPPAGAQVTVGGQSLDLTRTQDDALLDKTLTSPARLMGAAQGPAPGGDDGWLGSPGTGHTEAGPWPGTGLGLRDTPTPTSAPGRLMTGRELLLGSAFHLAQEGDGNTPSLAAWGRVTTGGFDGEAPADGGSVRIDGEVTTGILGTDAEWRRLLAGVALSVSEGEGTFDQPGVDSGTIESTMTTVSPYGRLDLSDRVSAWGLVGIGTGDMTIVQGANATTNQPERVTRTDLSMRLTALGGRGALLEAGESGGMDLTLKADAFMVRTEAQAVSNEGATTTDASRVRLVLEGSRAFRTDSGGVLTPGLELGLRHDGGDAETGTGVELGGRMSYAHPHSGLSLDASVRTLIAHEDSDYREWGASGALRLAPGERGRGLSFSLAPTWGTPSSGVDRLWSARDARGLAPGDEFEPESRLEGELGYGLPVFGGGFTGTPNLGFGLSDTARDYRIGWRLTAPGASGFEVNLDATRREPANDDGSWAAPEHGVMLRGAVHW